MKTVLTLFAIISLFIAALAIGDVKLNKTHKGMLVDGKKVNCAYCHKTNKIPKEGVDYAKYKKKKGCTGSACH